MNEKLQKQLTQIENMIAIQRDSNHDGYMHGMLNGLIVAHSVFSGGRPEFEIKTRRNGPKVRHRKRRKYKRCEI